jgi:PHD/YefM family antitoxin component YafN of YafNO toxin-antitoxin module
MAEKLDSETNAKILISVKEFERLKHIEQLYLKSAHRFGGHSSELSGFCEFPLI